MNKNLKTISFAFAMFAVVGMIWSTSVAFADDDELELEANLINPSGEIAGEAEFEVEDLDSELEIEIPSLPFTYCDVNINEGQIVIPNQFLDYEGEVEIEGLPVDLVIDSVSVDCGGNVFTSDTFVSETDEEDDEDDDDDHLEIESSSNKKPKKIKG